MNRLTFVLLASLLLCCLFPAGAEELLPPELLSAVKPAAAVSSAAWYEGSESTWFIAARDDDGTNVLHGFILREGLCVDRFVTAAALPQGEGAIRLYMTDGAWDLSGEPRYVAGPILLITQCAPDNQSVLRKTAFRRDESGAWLLLSLTDSPSGTYLSVDDGMVTCDVPGGKGQMNALPPVPCTFDTELRTFSLSDAMICP